MEINTNNVIRIEENTNIINFIRHGYNITINNRLRNWNNVDIKALEEQCINDITIFYGKIVNMRQKLIDSWITNLLRNNNVNQVKNLAIEFKNKPYSSVYNFYANAIENEDMLKITINYDN